jgi:6-phosphogluconate dehydrogenase
MQLIAEIYDVLKELADLNNTEMADVFSDWNKSKNR